MHDMHIQPQIPKAALFLDFENIYIGLLKIDPVAARKFAQDPRSWLRWIEQGAPSSAGGSAGESRRSVLIRRCYLSPSDAINRETRFADISRRFTHAGFSVIPCSPLTQQGKNSADIHMVIDILDTLANRPPIDEYIIMSGDADFTPVLLRLRTRARKTTIITNGSAAGAYIAACDRPIGAELFVDQAIGRSDPNLLDVLAQRLAAAVESRGEIPLNELYQVFQDIPDYQALAGKNSFGFGTPHALAHELVRRSPKPLVVSGYVVRGMSAPPPTPRREAIAPRAAPPADPPADPTPDTRNRTPDERAAEQTSPSGGEATGGERTATPDNEELHTSIVAEIQEMIGRSPDPVSMVVAASQLNKKFGPQIKSTQWAGKGKFRALIESQPIPGVELRMVSQTQGYLYNPARHIPPTPLPKQSNSFNSSTNAGTEEIPAAAESKPPEREAGPEAPPAAIADAALHDLSLFDDLDAAIPGDEAPAEDGSAASEAADQDLLDDLINMLGERIGAPDLTSSQYTVVFEAITEEAGQRAYDPSAFLGAVQQRCFDRNQSILRRKIAAVLEGLRLAGYTPEQPAIYDTPEELAKTFRNSILLRCWTIRLELADREYQLIDDWILGS